MGAQGSPQHGRDIPRSSWASQAYSLLVTQMAQVVQLQRGNQENCSCGYFSNLPKSCHVEEDVQSFVQNKDAMHTSHKCPPS